jgi:aminoglycoside/choline kinase family phosphotransferase
MTELDLNKAKFFLNSNSIVNYEIKKIAGDASFRSYYRIFCADKNLILMFAPPQFEDVAPFIKIDKFLVENNFSAPKILAIDLENGFLLLEDLGDDTYNRVLQKNYSKELEFDLYKNAVDCLIELQQKPNPQDVAPYNNAVLFREMMLFIDWYLPLQKKLISLKQKAHFKFLCFQLFDLLSKEKRFQLVDWKNNAKQVLVLRDYHADNLMNLEERANHQKVGLLDFQDALIGSKAYDLVSLLEDARRDVNLGVKDKVLNYFLEKSGVDKESFMQDYEILSLQRNLKIVGIFSRLSMRDHKHQYLDLLPRVLNFVEARAFSNNPIFLEIGNFLKLFLQKK